MPPTPSVISILRSRRFNSEPPYRESDIAAYCDKQSAAGLPVRLVGFWGVGPKAQSNQADRDTCDFLQKISDEVSQLDGEARWHFIFSKSHGLWCRAQDDISYMRHRCIGHNFYLQNIIG